MSTLRGKKRILKRAGQLPRRPGVNDMSNNPRPFSRSLPRAQVTVRQDEEGKVRTFDARTGEYRWIPLIEAR